MLAPIIVKKLLRYTQLSNRRHHLNRTRYTTSRAQRTRQGLFTIVTAFVLCITSLSVLPSRAILLILIMYICLTILFTNLASCYSYAEYDLFNGFGGDKHENLTTTTTAAPTTLTTNNILLEMQEDIQKSTKHKCPEEERPINIGSYEVPTQRDLVLMTKTMLTKLFNAYNQQVLLLSRDVKEATKASVSIEKTCEEEQKPLFRKCVKQVSMNSDLIIKNLFASLKNKKMDVAAITEDKICNISSMRIDPLELIKVLALENASLQFALPGFLRLLSACSYYCTESDYYYENNPHHPSDLELVVKHFLTQNNYVQFILNKTQ